MKLAVPKSPLGSEFDNFLFTALGEDGNGLSVTVVSLLARLNLDPWQEAGTLAALSAQAATKRLASSLDTLTDQNLRRGNSEARVQRLLALLPARVSTPVQPTVTSAGTITVTDAGKRIGIIVFITSAIFLVGSQLFATRPDPSIQPAEPQAAVLPIPSHTLTTPPAR
jgi:hypothetical protein